jgi:hypothetical protein
MHGWNITAAITILKSTLLTRYIQAKHKQSHPSCRSKLKIK